jgi:DNA-binding NarL/FixJ family response regulator
LDALDQLVAELGIEVLGRTTDADEAVALIGECRPDVFIAGMDAAHDGFACVRRAKQARPGLKAIVVADETATETIDAAFAAGATIYCVKTAEQQDLASAIRQAFQRSIYMAGSAPEAPAVPEPVTSGAVEELTRRELEILRLAAEGHSNSQLARMLWVTEQTVKFHLSNIYRKLDVANRTEASRWAQLHGLLSAQPAPEAPEVETIAAA